MREATIIKEYEEIDFFPTFRKLAIACGLKPISCSPILRQFVRPQNPKGVRSLKRRQTSAPLSIILEGTLERGVGLPFSVGGVGFDLAEDVWIVGNLHYGSKVSVSAQRSSDGNYVARCVTSISHRVPRGGS